MAYVGSQILAILTLVSNVFILTYLFLLISGKKRFMHSVKPYALWFGLIVSLVAMLGSLYYSDILGYEPCRLCWYQRIFMYSQVFMFATALLKSDTGVWKYSLPLSWIGAVIAAYHYYIQIAIKPILAVPCSAVGYSASCTETFTTSFGYITIPLMALSAFILLIILGMDNKSSTTGHSLPPHMR
jgi:disulfide bond formation protein DsbB